MWSGVNSEGCFFLAGVEQLIRITEQRVRRNRVGIFQMGECCAWGWVLEEGVLKGIFLLGERGGRSSAGGTCLYQDNEVEQDGCLAR